MIEVTPEDILNGDWNTLDPDHMPFRIYEVVEGDVTLYIGKSRKPFNRIVEHFDWMPRGNYQIQQIRKAYPDIVRTWKVRLYTLQDCETVIMKHFDYLVKDYHDPRYYTVTANRAEIAMIQEKHPCLNRTYNDEPAALPERYQYVNLDDNAVDYIHL